MSGVICSVCLASTNEPRQPQCQRADCPGKPVFFHAMPKDECKHDFQGWREIVGPGGGRGGERVCTKCGIGAMEHSMRYLP